MNYQPWPILSKDAFQTTAHLLHMGVQMIGKLMLMQPFEPHWANLAMPLTSRGISTGMIPFGSGTFSVDMDFIDHVIIFTSSWGKAEKVNLESMSVAMLYQKIFKALGAMGVDVKINLMPQEVSNPIAFDQDTESRVYDAAVVNAWWRIMVSTYRVLLTYHAKFFGVSPRIGLFWGTLDLRDARYQGVHLPIPPEMDNFIGRNAYDDVQFEVGWSASNETYPLPSFFACTYPKPEGFELAKIKPAAAKWVPAINEFIVDYEDIQKSTDPERDLLAFFESSYQAAAELGQWDAALLVSGKPEHG